MNKLNLTSRKALAVFIIMMWLWLFIQVGVALRSLLSSYRLFTVISGSMEPTLPTGCIIVVNTNKGTLFTAGDIITFHDQNEFITHRIINLDYDDAFYYQTHGDANLKPDAEKISHQRVLGRVVFATPAALLPLLHLMRSHYFPLLFIVLIVCYMAKKRIATQPRKANAHIIKRAQWHITHKH
jgi:signal peptidase I